MSSRKLALSYPVYPHRTVQKFGQDDACVNLVTRKVTRMNGGKCPVNSGSLYRLQGMIGHNGADLAAYSGQPVYHAGPEGRVEETSTEEAKGLGVGIVSWTQRTFVDGTDSLVKMRYWHLKALNVSMGQTVSTGDLIGWADNTGSSSGDHLHFEVKPVDIKSDGSVYNLRQDNGYFGAVDPEIYWTGEYVHHYSLIEKIISWLRNLF